MNFSKKIFFIIMLAAGLFLAGQPLLAQGQESANLYLFYNRNCPHCQNEKVFLKKLEASYGQKLTVQQFEVGVKETDKELLKAVQDIYQFELTGVPLTIIGDQLITGYLNDETTGEQIKQYLEQCLEAGCSDKLGEYLKNRPAEKSAAPKPAELNPSLPKAVKLPFLGQIETKDLSLPVLTIVIAAFDGFNPCAMWVLVFLIGLLLGLPNRKRRWLLGLVFLAASGAVYFIFMAAWLKLFLFIGFIAIIRIIIGLVALFSGGYNLREYWLKRTDYCKVTTNESRRRIFDRLKAITQKQSLWWALLGIILLAFSVNLVELICSIGLPAVYTQILSLSNLAAWQYYGYLLLYILIFMLDDIIVFTIAMITLEVTGLSGKYSRFSYLVGGLVMLLVGLLLIFKPNWLTFG